jgi:molybdopterin-containing oxidoreductase family iron-sulfur binding subunit
VREAAKDLRAHAGSSIIIASGQQTAEVQALAFAMNDHLKNVGSTVSYIKPVEANPAPQIASLEELSRDMQEGKVSALLILGANPVYHAPASLGFSEALKKVPLRIRLGLYDDETSYQCHWHLPESHFLEAWGDARAFNGVASIQQPLISPLYETKPAIELLSILLETPGRTAYQALQDRWGHDFNEKAIQDGIIGKMQEAPVSARLLAHWTGALPALSSPDSATLEATLRPDPTIWDGRYANNSWLQELPKPILQLTWDNAILISPATAQRLALNDSDEVELKASGRTVRGPILRIPGHPDNTLTLTFGYGRDRGGEVAKGHGYNAFAIQDHHSPYSLAKVELTKTGKQWTLATVHTHQSMEGRDIVVRATKDEFQAKQRKIVKEEYRELYQPSLLPKYPSIPNAWAMVIDLTTCIGCKACTIACQAENNIPVVGKSEVRNSRQMHWIRVDRYFEGSAANPKVYFQPVPCMHCEKAPCEYVCPTEATNHSHDGLNQMVYNRCVGTRYCSNNCPYKVRRFNFFQYSDMKNRTVQLMYNPDVTVRSRGVMEKCTYCVQRIQEVRISAEKENRPIRDGEVVTACQQACPTDAIIFGDKNDHESRVAKLRELAQNYYLLAELGTQPRTSYLASLRNPNPSMQEVT